MAQSRRGDILLLLLAVALAIPMMLIGSLIVATIAAMHSGMMDDAPKKNMDAPPGEERDVAGDSRGLALPPHPKVFR